jgi:hypothetical protein
LDHIPRGKVTGFRENWKRNLLKSPVVGNEAATTTQTWQLGEVEPLRPDRNVGLPAAL